MNQFALCDRKDRNTASLRGLSCDEDGVFLAGDVPLVIRSGKSEPMLYKVRPIREVEALLSAAYPLRRRFDAEAAGLDLLARYMNEGKWALAKIAAVHLRLPEVTDDRALTTLLATDAACLSKRCSRHQKLVRKRRPQRVRKRDVSDEPRIPAGQSGGGEWTSDGGYQRPTSNPLVTPAQTIAPPMPIPFELPISPEEVTPAPFALPGAGLRPPPLVNPYPNKRKCVEEWAEAEAFCAKMESEGKLVPGPPGKRSRGYSGFGKDYNSCVLGQVSEECGGNPTA